MLERISQCYTMNGRPKKRIFSVGESLRKRQAVYEHQGKILLPYLCSECGYVHHGGRPKLNTKKKCAGRLGELKRMGIVK